MNAHELVDQWNTALKPHERHANHAETMYWIEQYRNYGEKASRMIEKLLDTIHDYEELKEYTTLKVEVKQKPLSDEKVDELVHGCVASAMLIAMETNEIDASRLYREIGRAIEKAHGIK